MPPKRKQSKANWRKRGAAFEEAALAARQRRDQDLRTGGSFSGLSDADLFSVTGKDGKDTAPRGGRAQRRPLYTERNVAANPHVPIVSKAKTEGAKPRKPNFDSKIAKLRARAEEAAAG